MRSRTILTVSGHYPAAVARVGAGVLGWVLGTCHVLTNIRQLLSLHAEQRRHQALISWGSDTTNNNLLCTHRIYQLHTFL